MKPVISLEIYVSLFIDHRRLLQGVRPNVHLRRPLPLIRRRRVLRVQLLRQTDVRPPDGQVGFRLEIQVQSVFFRLSQGLEDDILESSLG